MPTTVNGIGTHYYGKKNHSVRAGVCRACGRNGNLESYDTRLWFVIVFIPIIPLGRKRIIDQCPSCRRHFVADADSYEQARQLQTSGSLERYRREPSPEVALETHAQFLIFHEHDQAAEFRRAALERFPDHANLRAGLAAQLEQVASYNESAALYEDALALDADLTEARIGVARRRMAQGQLDEARRLLDFLEEPGAGQHYTLGPLDVLSTYYQRAGRHEEALTIAEHLLREYPPAGLQHSFRTFVRKSERALGRRESILPKQEHSLRGLFRAEGSPYPTWVRTLVLFGIGLVLLGAGLLINNEYIRRHRTIHVVNACGQPVQVRVDDGPPQTIGDQGVLTVSEGRHRLRLEGPVNETEDVQLQAGFFDRWFSKPLWVLNPGGEAVLQEETVYYAEHPQPTAHQLLVGQPFLARSHVDYAFEEPPHQMQVSSKNAEVVKSAVVRFQGQDSDAFLTALATDKNAALTFAEHRLRRHPNDAELLSQYLRGGVGDGPRVEAFLKTGLDHRPVSVPWHRAYQSFAELNHHDDGLIALYDGFLKSDPKNGALLYLRGRIDPDWDRQDEFYQRSLEADPRLPWPWMARGVRAASSGRWAEAARDLRKARELKIEEDQVREWLHAARIATGDTKALIEEYKSRIMMNAVDPMPIVLLCDALAASGQGDKIEAERIAWENRLAMPMRPQLAAPVRAIILYEAGKLAECDQACREIGVLGSSVLRVQALLGLGRAKEVAKDPSFEKVWENPWIALALSLGLALDGQAKSADEWRERAIAGLERSFDEPRKAAAVLREAKPVPVERLHRVIVNTEDKALVYAVLAARFPEKRAEYHAAASQFNVRRKGAYHLVDRAIKGTHSASP